MVQPITRNNWPVKRIPDRRPPLVTAKVMHCVGYDLKSPHNPDGLWLHHALCLLCQRLNPKRRNRSNPRVIKRKMPKWHVKRAHRADWPQPTNPATATITHPQHANP
jgi:hypothetical protein